MPRSSCYVDGFGGPGEGDGQDFVSGILCGIAVGGAISTGGALLGLALIGCGALFGDW